MYDDYDLDYTYTNDYTDLDEYYTSDLDLDEDYARDAHDYESLAYRHYAWYNLDTHTYTTRLIWLPRSALYGLH
jgi:hypothetical protein